MTKPDHIRAYIFCCTELKLLLFKLSIDFNKVLLHVATWLVRQPLYSIEPPPSGFVCVSRPACLLVFTTAIITSSITGVALNRLMQPKHGTTVEHASEEYIVNITRKDDSLCHSLLFDIKAARYKSYISLHLKITLLTGSVNYTGRCSAAHLVDSPSVGDWNTS